MQIQSLNGSWQFRQTNSNEWLAGQVPGGVHTDLLELGRIPDPFVADNEKRVQWVAETDWIYRRNFNVSKEMLAGRDLTTVADAAHLACHEAFVAEGAFFGDLPVMPGSQSAVEEIASHHDVFVASAATGPTLSVQ